MTKTVDQWEDRYMSRQQQINDFARRCFQPRLKAVDKILLSHPDEHRRYLQHHPCAGCQADPCCDEPCQAYLKWYNARMEAVRVRSGGRC